MEPPTAVASRAGAGDVRAGFGTTGTTTTVDGGGASSLADGAGAGGVSVGAPAPAANAGDAAKGTTAVRRARVWAQRAIVFIEEIRR